MEPEDWEKFYTDLPNRTTKVYVKSKNNVVNTWDQTRCVEPKGNFLIYNFIIFVFRFAREN